MVEHHIQKAIIRKLVDSQTARYSDLKPDTIEGNVFTYHLQSLIKQKLVHKNSDGTYQLTNTGKLVGINNNLKKNDLLEQAHAVIFICVINQSNQWLLRKRLAQPMYGTIGFIHGEPKAGQTIEHTARQILQRRTGLDGTCTFKGSGFIHLHQNEETVAYTNFSLLIANTISGTLIAKDSHGENAWYNQSDITSNPAMLPSMADLAYAIGQSGIFYLDTSYTV